MSFNQPRNHTNFLGAPEKRFALLTPKPSWRHMEIVDPEGDAQDVHRFSTRQDASSKNPGFLEGGGFELDLSVFFGDFLCAKESHSRTSAKKDLGFTRKP